MDLIQQDEKAGILRQDGSNETNPQFGRVKGASWFPFLRNREILVLGAGGIGSWVAMMLARIGCRITVMDPDNYEEHNMSGQFVRESGIGVNKAKALQDTIREFSSEDLVTSIPEGYTASTFTNHIVICGFDNMEARKTAFLNWKDLVKYLVDKSDCFFQDGRLEAEHLQIYSIPGDRDDLIEKYEKEALFSDSEAAETSCTFKQTTHAAAMIASHMTGFLTNWADKEGLQKIPYYFEYSIPLNYTEKKYD